MASPGSAAFKTPTCFANDITNVPARVAAPKRTRSVMRQTALSFGPRSSSPPAAPDSSSSSPVIHSPLFTDNSDHAAASADAARLSSPLATSPSAAGGFLDARDDKMELDDEVAPANEHDDGELTTTTKRRRLMDAFEGPRLVCAFDLSKGKRKMETLYNMPGKQMSVFDAVRKRELGFKAGSAQVSMRPILSSYVSSNEAQVFRCPSTLTYRNFAPPFALQFSRAAKAGRKQTLAIADEEGSVNLINADRMGQWDAGTSQASFQAHNNAVFDLAWSHDDSLIATASGDQSVRLFDVESQGPVGELVGHTCTIKNVVWDPRNPSLLSTASRDGSIRIWDRRIGGESGSSIQTVNIIKNAHGVKGKTSKGRSAIRSVTAVTYLPQAENLLVSSGSADSIIKVWDLRKSHSRRVNPVHVESNEDAVANTDALRPHGISSMCLAPNGQKLYALSKDHNIYAFDPLNLTHATPLSTYHHPKAHYGTFYIRVAVSPCSRYVASGSSDCGVYLWDTEGTGRDGVRLLGHEKETSGLDWGHDKIASCSDDSLVRVWSHDAQVARRRRAQEKEVEWKWSGET